MTRRLIILLISLYPILVWSQQGVTTISPSVGSNYSYRDGIGWRIEKVNSSPTALTVLFSVDNGTNKKMPKQISGMSRLMCVCGYSEEFDRLVSNSWKSSSSAGQSASEWWTEIRNLDNLKDLQWVTSIQPPTLGNSMAFYWDTFNRMYNVSDRKLSNQYLVEVTFPPLQPGQEKFTLVDYGQRNRFIDIEIKNPYLSGIQTQYTESKLKDGWETYGGDSFEGIFEMLSYPNYRLGLKSRGTGMYDLIYLDSSDPRGWKVGELKAEVLPTATSGMFKAEWILSSKAERVDILMSIETGLMEVVGLDEDLILVKMYPTADMLINGGNKSTMTGGGGLVGSGSAVVIDAKNGYLVTNYHVASGGQNLRMVYRDNEFDVAVAATDEPNDLALLRIKGNIPSGLISLPISINDQMGDPIVTAGYPLKGVLGSDIKVTEGIISSTSYLGSSNMYQISAPITNGNSGGALLDNSGNLAGITQGGFRPDANTENVNAAVKSLMILALLQGEIDCKSVVGDENQSINFPKLENSVVIIHVY